LIKFFKYSFYFDVIVFVSGRKSSNGKALYTVCKNVNPNSYFVSSADEIEVEWFNGKQTVGIAGATSTPMWLMEQVKEKIEQLPVLESH
jgi:4-hydroxy-3-methylbut-2-enyl diphosphate reductase